LPAEAKLPGRSGSPDAGPDRPIRIPVAELEPGRRFDGALFHRDGTLLLLARCAVDEALVAALRAAGISEVFHCRSASAAQELRAAADMRQIDPAAIPDEAGAPRNLYNEAGELVCARGQRLGDLARSGAFKLFEEHSPYEAVRERFEEALARAVADTLERRIREDPELLRVRPLGRPFSAGGEGVPAGSRSRAGVERERRSHAMALAATHGLLERARREGVIDLPAAQDIVEEVLERALRDLPLALALAGSAFHHDYLVDHSLAVAIHALAMGLALGYDRAQCAELALAGLLHDIGMTRVSGELLRKEGPLTPDELSQIRSHPEAGLALLRRANGLAMPIPFVVFQNHERPDGRGYPRGVRDGWIHDYAKLVAVADIYQAMTAPRPYKPRRSPHRAVLQLLRMVQEDALDAGAVRAFLETHGVFPVGSWVRLSDGRFARVVGANARAYDRPSLVAVLDAELRPLRNPEPVELSSGDPALRIVEEAEVPAGAADFASGFHLERGEDVLRPETRGPRGRAVPTKFLDWSAGFSGFLTDFSVLDLIQILDVSQKSGVLFLRFSEAIGEIRFNEGEIMSAELTFADGTTLADEEAVYRMIDTAEGTFRFEQGAVDHRKTVRSNNATILMEGCRRQDEKKARASGGQEGSQ